MFTFDMNGDGTDDFIIELRSGVDLFRSAQAKGVSVNEIATIRVLDTEEESPNLEAGIFANPVVFDEDEPFLPIRSPFAQVFSEGDQVIGGEEETFFDALLYAEGVFTGEDGADFLLARSARPAHAALSGCICTIILRT